MFGVEKFSGGAIKPFDGLTETTSGSDHGAVWADFNV